MRLILHIFKKDVRRLWWEACVATAALALLAWLDSQRADYVPSPIEGILNLVVPGIWIYLVALAIHQENPSDGAQFWITRPYPRVKLVAAKALALFALIHLPSICANLFIVSARGFQPMHYLNQLLWKQLMLVAIVTLPAAALAAITRNLAQFASAVAASAISGAFFVIWADAYPAPWMQFSMGRLAITLAPVLTSAVAIIAMQYSTRRTYLARTVGVAAIVLGAASFAYIPSERTLALQCDMSPGKGDTQGFALTLNPGGELPWYPGSSRRMTVAIPVTLTGIPAEGRTIAQALDLTVSCQDGQVWKPSREQAPLSLRDSGTGWQMMYIETAALRFGRCTVDGAAVTALYRESGVARVPVGSFNDNVPALGHCASQIVTSPVDRDQLRVGCETPTELPFAGVRLVRSDGRREWKRGLGDSMPYRPYFSSTWLSPVHRRQTSFLITEERSTHSGPNWLLSRDDLGGARIVFTLERLAGCSIVRYQFRDVDLRSYLLKPR
jgi:hypothetical protein